METIKIAITFPVIFLDLWSVRAHTRRNCHSFCKAQMEEEEAQALYLSRFKWIISNGRIDLLLAPCSLLLVLLLLLLKTTPRRRR